MTDVVDVECWFGRLDGALERTFRGRAATRVDLNWFVPLDTFVT